MIIPVIITTSSVYIFFRDREQVKGVNIEETFPPYFTNLPPSSITMDQEYIFKPNIVTDRNLEGELILLEKPRWIYQTEDGYVKGTPLKEGSYKFVFKVTDGINSSTVIHYLLVTND